ncbi:MAG: competence/damage-inducible protein A [Acidobacteria bacterium]|nr:competence/damage-inducible protein A [Acidobacteriota bacterium]
MRAAILAIGSELLGTDRLDTNSLALTESLERHGVELVAKQVVGDSVSRIATTLRNLIADVDLLLVTGGLGPTSDDVTREAVAQATGHGLGEDPTIVEDIRRKFASFGREMPEVNRRQAMVIDGAEVIENPRGTAPGLVLSLAEATVFLFPGVPRELARMIEHRLESWLTENADGAPQSRLTLRVACLPESEVEELLAPVYAEFGEVGLLASPGDIRIRLRSADPEELARAARAVESCLGDSVYGRGDETLEEVVGCQLRERGLTLATAESCTGGWIAQRLTAVPGSSDYFLGAIVAYDDRVKIEQLGVPPETLASHGAVSRRVVEAMAEGAAERLGADWAVAVSGVAGPGGGSDEKPVGTVDVALARGDEGTDYRRLQLPGDRRTIRWLTTQWALDLIRRRLAEGAD